MPGNTSTDIWIAGAFAAFSVDLLVYPLDTLKTRIQSPDYRRVFVDPSTNVVNKPQLFRGLYQGLGSVILATLPASGAFFTTYEGTKSLLTRHNPTSPFSSSSSPAPLLAQPLIHSLSSGLAELVSCAILTPAEVIKQNAQMVSSSSSSSSSPSSSSPSSSNKAKPPTPSATLQTLHRFRHNPLALWRGYGALASRNLPFTALQFPLFERFKTALLDRRRRKKESSSQGSSNNDVPLTIAETTTITALAAGTAGSIAAVITTPIDVVKTRIMLSAATSFAAQEGDQEHGRRIVEAVKHGRVGEAVGAVGESVKAVRSGGHGEGSDGGKEGGGSGHTNPKDIPDGRKSSLQIGREIVREHGWKGLWRGGALRGAWTMLGSGLYLGVYEGGRLWLKQGRDGTGGDED